jgi:GT2 family glycosyltransferase
VTAIRCDGASARHGRESDFPGVCRSFINVVASRAVSIVESARDDRARTSAVILNFKTAAGTIGAVRSLERSTAPPDAIFVVDNASPDDSVEVFRSHSSRMALLVSEVNNGFAAGCNLGIRAALGAGAHRVFLLNADATVEPDTLGKLGRALDGQPDVGIVGPLVVSAANPDVIESAGVRYGRQTGRMRHLAHGASRGAVMLSETRLVDAVSGCAMLVRRDVFDAAGLLGEDYFYGFEDLEFCLRARGCGFRTMAVSTAVVRHEGQASIGPTSPRRLYFAVRNHLRVAASFGPQAWPLRAGRAAAVIGLTAAYAMGRSGVPLGDGLSAIGRGVRDHWRGRYGPDST